MRPAETTIPSASGRRGRRWLWIGIAAGAALGSAAGAQQFMDESAARFPTDPQEYSNQVTAGDLDGDGDLDLVFANGGGFTTPGTPEVQRIYINDGTGVFTDESAARLGFSGLCRGVELGDIDRDGDLDLIFAQDFDRPPALFRNDGTGQFTDISATHLPSLALSSSRAQFGDIDNDGDLDLYITSGSGDRFGCGQYRIYVNDGTGLFTDETTLRHPTENVCENMDCLFGDIDNDFDLDVRTAGTGSDNSRLYRNDGTGVFTRITGVPVDSTCYSYDFGDVDGDGFLDLLGVNGQVGTSGETLMINGGSGDYANADGQLLSNPSVDDNDSKFLDYDDDGDLDLLIARLGTGGERLYENDGGGTFSLTVGVVEVVNDSSLDVVLADVDDDGDQDFVTAQGESGSFVNRIYINGGSADTRPPRILRTEQLEAARNAGPLVVRALILDDMSSDRNFFADEILLHYAGDGGPSQQVAMVHSGGQVYRGELPDLTGIAELAYFVTARDSAGNLATGSTLQVTLAGIFADGFESGTFAAWDATVGEAPSQARR